MSGIRDRMTVVIAALLLLTAACTGGPGPEGEDGPTSPSGTPTQAGATTASPAEPDPDLELTGWQQTHPGGTTMAVRRIEVDEHDHVLLDVEVITGRTEIRLARFDTFLRDDQGADYELVPPADNPPVEIPTDSRMTGTLAFRGPLDPDARRITLAVNALGGEIIDADDDPTRGSSGPKMAFRDIPLPGAGLDDEADVGQNADLLDADSVDVEATQEHPIGVVVTITRIATNDRNVFIHLEVDNPTERQARMVSISPHLDQDAGQAGFRFQQLVDATSSTLDVPAGGSASATLAFRGAIHADSTALSLRLNGLTDLDDTDTGNPGFLFEDLPIPGRDAEG